jgi:glycosyltransferase involved in cell wall biosynthesis
VKRHQLQNNVTLIPHRIPHSEVVQLYSRSLIGLTPYLNNPKGRAQLQNKVVEFMGAGLPVITSPTSVNRQLVEAADCGAFAWINELKLIADTVEGWMDNPAEARELGKRGQAYAQRNLIWENELERVLKWLRDLQASKTR